MSPRADVGIVGGGPAGAVAAYLLARAGAGVVLFERTRYERERVGETLSPVARAHLERILPPNVISRTRAIESPGNLSAWGSHVATSADFMFQPLGLGLHLDRPIFDATCASAAANAGADVRLATRARHLEATGDGRWRIHVATGTRTSSSVARRLILATGRAYRLPVRDTRRERADRLVGISMFFASPLGSSDERTWVEAQPAGWWYSAPVPGGRTVVSWMTDADLLPRGRATLRAALSAQLARSPLTRERVAWPLIDDSPLHITCAASGRMLPNAGDGWHAIGDAAMTFDPLASAGLTFAILSAEAAAHEVLQATRAHCSGASTCNVAPDRWDHLWRAYLEQRATTYAWEQRWRDEPFWQRRRR